MGFFIIYFIFNRNCYDYYINIIDKIMEKLIFSIKLMSLKKYK